MTHLLFSWRSCPLRPWAAPGAGCSFLFPGFTARTLSIQVTMAKPPRAFAWLHEGGGSRAVKADETSAASATRCQRSSLPSIPGLGEHSSSVIQPGIPHPLEKTSHRFQMTQDPFGLLLPVTAPTWHRLWFGC